MKHPQEPNVGRVFVKQYWFSRKTKAAEHRQICLPYTKYAFASLPCSAAYFSRENCFAPQKDEICADLQVLTTRNTWLYSEEECLHKMCKDRFLRHYCFMNTRPSCGIFDIEREFSENERPHIVDGEVDTALAEIARPVV